MKSRKGCYDSKDNGILSRILVSLQNEVNCHHLLFVKSNDTVCKVLRIHWPLWFNLLVESDGSPLGSYLWERKGRLLYWFHVPKPRGSRGGSSVNTMANPRFPCCVWLLLFNPSYLHKPATVATSSSRLISTVPQIKREKGLLLLDPFQRPGRSVASPLKLCLTS